MSRYDEPAGFIATRHHPARRAERRARIHANLVDTGLVTLVALCTVLAAVFGDLAATIVFTLVATIATTALTGRRTHTDDLRAERDHLVDRLAAEAARADQATDTLDRLRRVQEDIDDRYRRLFAEDITERAELEAPPTAGTAPWPTDEYTTRPELDARQRERARRAAAAQLGMPWPPTPRLPRPPSELTVWNADTGQTRPLGDADYRTPETDPAEVHRVLDAINAALDTADNVDIYSAERADPIATLHSDTPPPPTAPAGTTSLAERYTAFSHHLIQDPTTYPGGTPAYEAEWDHLHHLITTHPDYTQPTPPIEPSTPPITNQEDTPS